MLVSQIIAAIQTLALTSTHILIGDGNGDWEMGIGAGMVIYPSGKTFTVQFQALRLLAATTFWLFLLYRCQDLRCDGQRTRPRW